MKHLYALRPRCYHADATTVLSNVRFQISNVQPHMFIRYLLAFEKECFFENSNGSDFAQSVGDKVRDVNHDERDSVGSCPTEALTSVLEQSTHVKACLKKLGHREVITLQLAKHNRVLLWSQSYQPLPSIH